MVPSPLPRRIFELRPIESLLAQGCVVICAGGGGIPTMYQPGTRTLIGVEAVIDKDRASAVLARDLRADALVIATDTDAVYLGWGQPDQRAIAVAHPDDLAQFDFPAGSMGPKVSAAIEFACSSGQDALIGSLADLPALLAGEAGTRVSVAAHGCDLPLSSGALSVPGAQLAPLLATLICGDGLIEARVGGRAGCVRVRGTSSTVSLERT